MGKHSKPQHSTNVTEVTTKPLKKRAKVAALSEPESTEPSAAAPKKKVNNALKKAHNLPLPTHYEALRKQFTVLNTTGGFLQSKGVMVSSSRLQSMGISFTPQALCQMAEVAPLAVTLTRAANGDIDVEFLNCGKQGSLLPPGPLAMKRATERRDNYFRVRLEEATEKWACEALGKKTVRKGSVWLDEVPELSTAPEIRQLSIPLEAGSSPMKAPVEEDEEESAMEERCMACRGGERLGVGDFVSHLALLPGYRGQIAASHEVSIYGSNS